MPEDVSIEVDSQKIARDELRKRIDDSGLGVTRFSKEPVSYKHLTLPTTPYV